MEQELRATTASQRYEEDVTGDWRDVGFTAKR